MARELVKPHWDKLVYAHRLTHIDNIPDILNVGFVHPSSNKANPNYVSIGDTSIIKVRDEDLHQGHQLSEYIPFYFGPHTPMLLVIQSGWNGVRKRNPEEIVHCVVRIDTIIEQGWDCIFTDGHAVAGITEFYTKTDLTRLDELVKVEDVYARYWKDELDVDLGRRKQAEILLKNEIPAQYIAGFFVYNEEAKQKIEAMGIDSCRICVAPEYYF